MPRWNNPNCGFQKGHIPWTKGKTLSEEHKRKMSETAKTRIGDKCSRWKGGRRINRGYIYIYSPNHPFTNKDKGVPEHRLIMEKHLGRYLSPKEVIHHINGIRNDNRILNLELFDSQNNHLKYGKIECPFCHKHFTS